MNPSLLEKRKSWLRSKSREILKGLREADRLEKSARVLAGLLLHSRFQRARRIMMYSSTSAEVDTGPIARWCLEAGKSVFFPYVTDSDCMEICRVRRPERELTRGHYGILAPCPAGRPVRPSILDIVLVPGLAFDRFGGRLGRGKGYFDRFLPRASRAFTIGLAFREQLVRKVPMGPHDIYLDEVIFD